MNFEGLEKKVDKRWRTITYWKDGTIVMKECIRCKEIKKINEFHFQNKKKGTYQSRCKECGKKQNKQYYEDNAEHIKNQKKQYRKDNAEHIKNQKKQYYQNNKEEILKKQKQYYKDNVEYKKEYNKQYYQDNTEHIKERHKQWRKTNEEELKEYRKQYRENNKEHRKEYMKQYYKDNVGHIKECDKQRFEKDKENYIIKLTEMLEQINPLLKKTNIKPYGNIYKVTNIKTNRVYIGQTIRSLEARYSSDIIKSWIKDRKAKVTQKFLDELIEEDFVITEIFDVACCQYHLNIIEAYWINYYDSYNNGYNNNAGHYDDDTGKEEFEQILKENGLQFIDGKLVKIA